MSLSFITDLSLSICHITDASHLFSQHTHTHIYTPGRACIGRWLQRNRRRRNTRKPMKWKKREPTKKPGNVLSKCFMVFLLGIQPASVDFLSQLMSFHACQSNGRALCLKLPSVICSLFLCMTNVMSHKLFFPALRNGIFPFHLLQHL